MGGGFVAGEDCRCDRDMLGGRRGEKMVRLGRQGWAHYGMGVWGWRWGW